MRPEGSLTIVRFALTGRKGEGASSSLAGLCQASWKAWHKSIRCRPHYVNKESCLKSGTGLGKQDIATPGEGGRGLVFLRSFLLGRHILNGPLLAATCMHCPRVDKK